MRVVSLAASALVLFAGCSSSQHAARRTVHVPLGAHRVFPSGELEKGDLVICGRHRGSFSAVVPRRGTRVVSSAGIRIDNKADGTVDVQCAPRANPL